MSADPPRSSNVVWQQGELDRSGRWAALGHAGVTVWMTGLPASGKSTVAAAIEARALGEGRSAYVLDGDNLRHGLNGDLGFSAEDRAENVRRTAEVAALMADAGVLVLVALVSPYRADRAAARAVHDRLGLPFLEVHVATSLGGVRAARPEGLVCARPGGRAFASDRRRRSVRAAGCGRRRGRRVGAAGRGRRAALGRAAALTNVNCGWVRKRERRPCRSSVARSGR